MKPYINNDPNSSRNVEQNNHSIEESCNKCEGKRNFLIPYLLI